MLHIDNITSVFCLDITILNGPKLIVFDFSKMGHQLMDKNVLKGNKTFMST